MNLFYRGKHRRPPRFRAGPPSLVVILVALATTSFALTMIRSPDSEDETRAVRPAGSSAPTPAPPDLPRKPDIYYIVFDTYGGIASLRDVLHYDNTPFVRALESRGFYVARDSTANYPRSLPSLASSLNMQYLEPLTERFGRNYGEKAPLENMLDDHLVGRTLRSMGYRWVHLGSWWKTTRESSAADESIVYGPDSVLPEALFGKPIVPASDPAGYRVTAYERVLFQFDQLAKQARERGPKFVFAHILCPHGPNVFNRQGHYRTRPAANSRGRAGAYLDQLVAMNNLILPLVDTLLDRPASKRPVVIIQADEGPYEGDPSHWEEFDERLALRKFPILNAYHLPGLTGALYSTITPVNSFRLVFDRYFEDHLPLLPDRNYTFRDADHLLDLTDVTDRVQEVVLRPPSGASATAPTSG